VIVPQEIRIESWVEELLDEYARFIDSSTDHVVNVSFSWAQTEQIADHGGTTDALGKTRRVFLRLLQDCDPANYWR
jgi:hypothetical protein